MNDFMDKIQAWIFPNSIQQYPNDDILNDTIGTGGVASSSATADMLDGGTGALPPPDHNSFNHSNFNENIVTTSVFIVMVLIFIGVLLIACCKVLIGCTARNFLTGNRNNRHANMIYAINGQILGGNGAAAAAAGASQQNSHNQQAPTLPSATAQANLPPGYDELSVYSLPPAYQFEPDKDSDKSCGDAKSINGDVELALQESLKASTATRRGQSVPLDDDAKSTDSCQVIENQGSSVIPIVEDNTTSHV